MKNRCSILISRRLTNIIILPLLSFLKFWQLCVCVPCSKYGTENTPKNFFRPLKTSCHHHFPPPPKKKKRKRHAIFQQHHVANVALPASPKKISRARIPTGWRLPADPGRPKTSKHPTNKTPQVCQPNNKTLDNQPLKEHIQPTQFATHIFEYKHCTTNHVFTKNHEHLDINNPKKKPFRIIFPPWNIQKHNTNPSLKPNLP